ncbi:MAG: sugar phosphate isomerase/epimerase [Planctomycetota bacterium]|nr:sugar phosphate isomerase/epimerase [Planctomycetota bacterium]
MSGNCPGALADGSGMRLAVTAAENAAPLAPILLRGDLAAAADAAGKIGYRGIEIHVPDIWSFDAGGLAAACSASGVRVSALVSGQLNVRLGLSLSDDDPGIVERALEGLGLFVEAAAALKSGVVIGWVRGRIGDRDGRAVLARQAEAIRRIDVKAGDCGVPLYIEAINRYEIDSLNTAAEAVNFIRENGLKNSYVHLDTFHMNIDEYSFAKAIRQCGPLLGYVHVAENTRHYPGHDRLDFQEVFAGLERIGYGGFVTVECLPLPDGMEAARRAFEYLSRRFVFQT